MRLAGIGDGMKRRDRTADAEEFVVEKDTDGLRPSAHDVVDWLVGGNLHQRLPFRGSASGRSYLRDAPTVRKGEMGP